MFSLLSVSTNLISGDNGQSDDQDHGGGLDEDHGAGHDEDHGDSHDHGELLTFCLGQAGQEQAPAGTRGYSLPGF